MAKTIEGFDVKYEGDACMITIRRPATVQFGRGDGAGHKLEVFIDPEGGRMARAFFGAAARASSAAGRAGSRVAAMAAAFSGRCRRCA